MKRGRLQGILVRSVILSMCAGSVALAVASPAQAAPTGPRGPHDKVPAGSVAFVDGDELIIHTSRPDGGGSIAIYNTGPELGGGIGLLNQLQARGVVDRAIAVRSMDADVSVGGLAATGAVDANAAAAPPSGGDPVYQCLSGYGLAKFWSPTTACTAKIRWRWNGFADPQVYFRDHTPSQWPVSQAVASWNAAVGIDVYHTTGSCPGGGRNCVNVWNAYYDTGWYGFTYVDYDSSYYFISGAVVVHLNDKYSSSEDNRGTACHELGHALGLGHNGSLSSCLYASAVSGPDPAYPHSSDLITLRYVIYP